MIEAMPASVLARIRSDRAAWPGVPAGAAEAEPYPSYAVTADPSVLNTDGESFYGDPVLIDVGSVDGFSGGCKDATRTTTAAETARRDRLSRWQEQR